MRQDGHIVSAAVIVAVGVNGDGRREVLGMDVGPSEAETFWTDFLRKLARRGLHGVKLVISDAHEGIKTSVSKVMNASWQRCRVHVMRTLLAHADRSGRRVVSAFIATAFAQDDAEAARLPWRHVAHQLRPKPPKPAALMDGAEVDVPAYIGFPAQHRVKLHATNRLERLIGEIKRHTKVVGIVPNEDAVTRLVGAILLERSDVYRTPPPCQGFQTMTTAPVLAVVYPASLRGNTAAPPYGFRESAAKQMDELMTARIVRGLLPNPVRPVRHHRMLPTQASAARRRRRPCHAVAATTAGRR